MLFAGAGGRRRDAGAAAAGAEPDQEGGGSRGALQSAAGADGQPERPGGAVQPEGEHVQAKCKFLLWRVTLNPAEELLV